jgi:integrase
MAGTVRKTDAKGKPKSLESRTSRAKLKRGRAPHWVALVPGKVHIGYQRWKGGPAGRWLLRRYISSYVSEKGNNVAKYAVVSFATADDDAPADGVTIMSYEQAVTCAREMIDSPRGGKIARMTVRQAMDRYVEFKRHAGQPVADLLSRSNAHILPHLGDLVVSDLTAERLRRWLAGMANSAAQTRPKAGQPQYRAAPSNDEDVRRRRATANRVLTMLKAALNHAFDEGHVSNRDAWGRKLKPFREVEVARIRYLTVAEAQRLINSADPAFRPLLRAALETGARYSELTRLEVQDFNADAGTVAIRKSKSGKTRHIILTDEGTHFFQQHCAGRSGHELMFQHSDGSGWKASEQGRPMDAANEHAKLKPPITFHGLRHTWASLAVMNNVPLMVVAKNLGHADTGMVEKHYGHLAPSFITEALRAGAPRYGIKADKKVVPLR